MTASGARIGYRHAMGCAVGLVLLVTVCLVGIGWAASLGAEGVRLVLIWGFLAAVWCALCIPYLRFVRAVRWEKQLAPARAAKRKEHLIQPDPLVAQERFGGSVPADVDRLFAHREALLRLEGKYLLDAESPEDSPFLAELVPLDGETDPYRESLEPVGLVALAGDDFGNAYAVRLGDYPDDGTPVLFWEHEGGRVSELGCTVEEMFTREAVEELPAG